MSSPAVSSDPAERAPADSGEVWFRRIGAVCTILLALGGVAVVGLLVARTAEQPTPAGAVTALLLASLVVVLPSVALSIPLALLMAVFASAYCPAGLRSRARDAVSVLGSCPPLLWALAAVWVALPAASALGATLVSPFGRSVAVLVLVLTPPLAAAFVEQLRALPDELVFAGRALGGNTFAVHWHVLFPAIFPVACRAVGVSLVRGLGEGVALVVVLGDRASSRALAGELVSSLLGGNAHLAGAGFAAGALLLVVTSLVLLSVVHALTSAWNVRS